MSNEYTKVADLGTPPWDSIAKVYMKKWGSSYGSGALVSNRHVLTAAHNVYHTRWAKRFRYGSVTLNLGHQELEWRSTRFRKNSVRWLRGYSPNNFSRDLALITLPKQASSPKYSFRMPLAGEVSRLFKQNLPLHVGGYPGMDDDLNIHHGGNTLKTSSTTDYHLDGSLIRYDVNTARGNSGGPVWFTKEGEYILAGIHVAEESQGLDNNPLDAKAVLLDSETLIEVQSWF